MIEVNSNFIGNFKLGDNISHNLKTLKVLYSYYESDEENRIFLLKPIIVTLVSVIEALLFDFHLKARVFTVEGIKGLPREVLDYIRSKHLDKLEHYIVSAKKHDFFNLADTDFYDSLDELRRLRNRIHIQNEKRDFEADESEAFCEGRKEQAEKVLEKIMRVMTEKYGRPPQFTYVENFVLPWSSHF